MGNENKYLRIGQLAELAGVSARTIDYYTQLGLIHEAARTPGNHRLYAEETLKIIKMIKEIQKQHYSLEEIAHLLAGKEKGEVFEKIVSISQHLDELQKEVTELVPALQVAGGNPQIRMVSQELINKGLCVIQALMILLGEPMI
ncbi:transcriptional regulator, MerR family [Thermincola ferriacetica]|uniref:Transcriptional regulator, MerR family n=2 Tax=Thermincola TaxID=278993 RepID=D5XBB0_THEPJ|nr:MULTISPECIES: MerR family transcriptional regulator [Thermincola]ADG81430.1 transcriptional regulator, MerR family [Thermincola potens JR]KNZ68388.1 transcriptional regulator, MerR family [Thermincola ferriacetica]